MPDLCTLKFDTSPRTLIFKDDYNDRLEIKDGSMVEASGFVSTYVRDGSYQLHIKKIEIEGQGDLYFKFMKLKEKLDKKGYFLPLHKKEIPRFPKRIGVVTSPTGAVIRDIINVIERRYPKVDIILYPVLVQGPNSSQMIKQGIEYFNSRYCVDTIIVGRGGGAIEELWSFNEEVVADAIFNSKIPIISAVGHETDFTISDFVADLRAPTPSAAAEIATPNLDDVLKKLDILSHRIRTNVDNKLRFKRQELEVMSIKINKVFERENLYNKKIQLSRLRDKIEYILRKKIDDKFNRLELLRVTYEAMNPRKIINRGYSIVERNGKVITTVEGISVNEDIDVILHDGKLRCRVVSVKKEDINIKGAL